MLCHGSNRDVHFFKRASLAGSEDTGAVLQARATERVLQGVPGHLETGGRAVCKSVQWVRGPVPTELLATPS